MDFIKMVINEPDEVKRLWEHPGLSFYQYSERTSRYDRSILNTKNIRQFKNEDVLVGRFNNKLELAIKPHYMANDGVHNADDLQVQRCISTLKQLLSDLEITQPEHYKIVNLEYGLNLVVPNYSVELIRYAKRWKRYEFFNHKEGIATAKMSYSFNRHGKANLEKLVKLYHKFKQKGMSAHCHPDCIRYEVKSKKSRFINSLGIKHLGHLLEIESYNTMANDLIKVSKEILFLDHNVYTGDLTPKDQQNLNNYYLNDHTWEVLIEDSHRNTFIANKKKYLSLLDKTGSNIHTIFTNCINEKLEDLKGTTNTNCANVPTPRKCAEVPMIKRTYAHSSDSKHGNSIVHHQKHHNYFMLYLHGRGIEIKRDDYLNRRVRNIIAKDQWQPHHYAKAIERLRFYLINYHDELMEMSKIHELISQSRTKKKKHPVHL